MLHGAVRTRAIWHGRSGWKIIGHSTHRRPFAQIVTTSRRLSLSRSFALALQPPREQCRRGFLQPDIEQLDDLFANICGVTQPRQLKILQRRMRSPRAENPTAVRSSCDCSWSLLEEMAVHYQCIIIGQGY